MAPKAVGNANGSEEGLGTIGMSAPLSFDSGKSPVSGRSIAFDGDVGRAPNIGKGKAEGDGAIVNTNASGLVAKCIDGSENVGPCGGGVGLILEESSDDETSDLVYNAEVVAIAGEVGCKSKTP